ncbi:DUF6082 family protein [Microbispora rosea]|uniref:DUF6082 family protein n=1 Tax=Microbispora rosea TaxID=58117 RepID=UPI003424AC1C
MSRLSRRSTYKPVHLLSITLTVLTVLIGAALTITSPIAMSKIAAFAHEDWEQLSYIGQTYGAASAIFSALALTGVAASLILQARQARATRKEIERNHHFQLMEMAINDPELLACWGATNSEHEARELRQRLYLNLIISYWEMMHEVGETSTGMLRSHAQTALFSQRLGYEFWTDTRMARLAVANNARQRRFWKIIDEEYQTIRPSRAVLPEKSESPRNRLSPSALTSIAVVAITVIYWTVRTSRKKNGLAAGQAGQAKD